MSPLKPLTIEHLSSLPQEPHPDFQTFTQMVNERARLLAENMPLPNINLMGNPTPSPGMLQTAETALEQYRAQLNSEATAKAKNFIEAQWLYRREPSLSSFNYLMNNCQTSADKVEAYNFITETLRPEGFPRDGPFVWTSPTTDTAETQTPSREQITMATKSILTPPGVASFLNLKTPRAVVTGGELRYSLSIIFDKAAMARPEFKKLQEGIDAAIKDKWPARLPTGLKSPFHDAGDKAGTYEGYKAGDVFISPWSKDAPGCINVRKEDIIDWSDFYAGWLVRANVRPFAYDQGGNKGCSFFLDSVQFLKPGPRLDGRKAANQSFPDDASEFDDEMV